jgi:alcohol dehydrogenase
MVMRGAIGVSRDCDAALQRIFGADLERGARQLEDFLGTLDISTEPDSYGVTRNAWASLIEDAFQGDRGRNYIGRRSAFGEADASGGATD